MKEKEKDEEKDEKRNSKKLKKIKKIKYVRSMERNNDGTAINLVTRARLRS